MENPNLDILAGAGFVVKSSASSLAARFSALRLELSPPLLEETVLVFTGFSASSSGPGEVETTYQDELLLLSRLMGAATSKSINTLGAIGKVFLASSFHQCTFSEQQNTERRNCNHSTTDKGLLLYEPGKQS